MHRGGLGGSRSRLALYLVFIVYFADLEEEKEEAMGRLFRTGCGYDDDEACLTWRSTVRRGGSDESRSCLVLYLVLLSMLPPPPLPPSPPSLPATRRSRIRGGIREIDEGQVQG